ncbi:glycosyltransferase family 4 protein [Micromonospora maritima]|uniref:Glycosyltransferase family 4 protein n=1 Tax=Micromonospora maritima TaxID=986711 RepID=A0ABW7ZG63_9ACTN
MRVVVATESRCLRTPDGRVWIQAGPDHRIWARYLSVFTHVRIVARVLDVPVTPAGALRVDGDGVEVWPVPYYVGPRQYLLRRPSIKRAVRAATSPRDAVILRVPSPIGSLLADAREQQGLPYALEVIGDPYDVFAPGVVRHPLRPVLRRASVRRLRQQCRRAAAVAYETERHLQRRYPARPGAPTAAVSSADLPPAAYVPLPRPAPEPGSTPRIVSIGSLEQMYKGVDTLLTALARLAATGLRPRLVHVGDGRFRPQLEHLADRLGVAEQVTFAGILPTTEDVRRRLDAADLFAMPSRTEGLPRALIEAMARGLPAIASTVGGVPELLAAEDLVPPGDAEALATAIRTCLTDPGRMAAASARNLTRSRDFSAEFLTPRRTAYYRAVAEATDGAGRASRSGGPVTSATR